MHAPNRCHLSNRRDRRGAATLVLVSALLALPLVPGGALADPAKRASGGDRSVAEKRFEGFAAGWLADLRKQERRARDAGQNHIGPGEDFRTEVRATGSARAPFVGILHYTEHRMKCRAARTCQRAGTHHVSEIFRYQNGQWIY